MTTIYLALGGAIKPILTAFDKDPLPAALCSYVYYDKFEELLMNKEGAVRSWVLDSGAYSAKHSGKEIKLQEYIDFCKRLADSPNPPEAIFSLDVIGDWRGTEKNTVEMWKQGVEAIPCYHSGEPEDVLVGMARDYPRIAIGGAAGKLYGEERVRYLRECFARIWPKKVHGFGIATMSILQEFPFHSVDATSWEIGPLRYGRWKGYGGLSTPGLRAGHNLRPEADVFLKMEDQLRFQWRKQLKQLKEIEGP